MIQFFAAGIPAPKGSTRAFVVKGRARVTNDNAATKPWQLTVAWTAREAMEGRPPMQGPIRVEATFQFIKPKSAKKRVHHTVKPDVDKLLRACLDALKQGGAYQDDSQVVVSQIRKIYADRAGADVTVEAAK
jgi:Holliday junction resolvase RusA-like endonuclease